MSSADQTADQLLWRSELGDGERTNTSSVSCVSPQVEREINTLFVGWGIAIWEEESEFSYGILHVLPDLIHTHHIVYGHFSLSDSSISTIRSVSKVGG